MSITKVQNCPYSVNVIVLVAGKWNQLVVKGFLLCKIFIPWNEVRKTVAENDKAGVAWMACIIRKGRVAVLFVINKNCGPGLVLAKVSSQL